MSLFFHRVTKCIVIYLSLSHRLYYLSLFVFICHYLSLFVIITCIPGLAVTLELIDEIHTDAAITTRTGSALVDLFLTLVPDVARLTHALVAVQSVQAASSI